MAKVFLSSNFTELRAYRAAAVEAIERAGHQCERMELFPASDRLIDEFCRSKVQECDLVVLLLGTFYGTPKPGTETAYTELEYLAAKKASIPILAFVLQPDGGFAKAFQRYAKTELGLDWQRKKQEAFTRLVMSANTLPGDVSSADDLKTVLLQSLHEHFGSARDGRKKPTRNEMLLWACDRVPQVNAFSKTFVPRGSPQIHLLFGDRSQRHQRCVQKLLCRHINRDAKALKEADERLNAREESGDIPPYLEDESIAWPEAGPEESAEDLWSTLVLRMFQTLEETYPYRKSLPPADFLELARKMRAPFIVMRHAVPWELWDERARKVIREWFLPFWDKVAEIGQGGPQFLTFFEFSYRKEAAPARESIEKELDESFEVPQRKLLGDGSKARAAGRANCFRLPPLEAIHDYQLDLFAEHYEKFLRPYLGAARLTDMFKTYPVSMAELETRLNTLMEKPMTFDVNVKAAP